jgi:hypothetical protein
MVLCLAANRLSCKLVANQAVYRPTGRRISPPTGRLFNFRLSTEHCSLSTGPIRLPCYLRDIGQTAPLLEASS